jgi:shikimate kinase
MDNRATRGIFLLGFMGSGKTAVGVALAARLGRRFENLDDRVEAAAGRRIADIFRDDGEPAFRALETAALRSLLAEMDERPGAVVALGGGTWVQPANRQMLDRFGGLTVFLECPVETMIQRCGGLDHRPLFQDAASFARLYQDRLPAYRLAAVTWNTAAGTAEDVAEGIASGLEAVVR